jgi:hypothetical protein
MSFFHHNQKEGKEIGFVGKPILASIVNIKIVIDWYLACYYTKQNQLPEIFLNWRLKIDV